MLNQARLKALKVREDHVRNVLDEARKRLGEVTRDTGRYKEILHLLIIQGLYQVMFLFYYLKLSIIIYMCRIIITVINLCNLSKEEKRLISCFFNNICVYIHI